MSIDEYDTFDGFLSHFWGTIRCSHCDPCKNTSLVYLWKQDICSPYCFSPLKDIWRNFVPISYTIILQFYGWKENEESLIYSCLLLIFLNSFFLFHCSYLILFTEFLIRGHFCTLLDCVSLIVIFKLDKARKTFLSDTIVFEWYLLKPTIFFFLLSNELNKSIHVLPNLDKKKPKYL